MFQPHILSFLKIKSGCKWQKNPNNSDLSQIKVNFFLIKQFGGRWSKDRWYVHLCFQASKLFFSLFCLDSVPKFTASSEVATLGQSILDFTETLEGKKKDKDALSPFKNTAYNFHIQFSFICLPGGSAGKESACNVGEMGLIPRLRRSPGEGNSYPLQYSGPGEFHGL